MSAIEQRQIDEDLNRLDVGIRQLKVQYDMFMAGSLKTPPRELRAQLERLERERDEGREQLTRVHAQAAEAEAAREARAKVVAAEGEQKASKHLREAALVLEQMIGQFLFSKAEEGL